MKYIEAAAIRAPHLIISSKMVPTLEGPFKALFSQNFEKPCEYVDYRLGGVGLPEKSKHKT